MDLETKYTEANKQTEYYQTELAKAHEILGRVIHQLSERWDTVRLTKYYPTDNLNNNRTLYNVNGIKDEN
ncbi:MAG: hypothetical protein KAS32_01280 [Candidatus Peribacteraceae bacterium]|nr:hypothetical protein [Candidatus Peribacteraceae bacterium]